MELVSSSIVNVGPQIIIIVVVTIPSAYWDFMECDTRVYFCKVYQSALLHIEDNAN